MKYSINGPVLVTGGAGFIGSHIVDRLVNDGIETVALDNLSAGMISNLTNSEGKKNFSFIKEDMSNLERIKNTLKGIKTIFHMAADPEVRTGFENPESTYTENLKNTFYFLEEIRKSDVEKIIFASSSAVYGDAHTLPTPENYGPLLPISAYGASKLACEAYISSYCNNHGIEGRIVRPANIIGSRGRHGVTWDFINKLKKNPNELEILGNGKQKKSYIHVTDGVEGFLCSMKNTNQKVELYNLGSEDSVDVMSIANIVIKNVNSENAKIITTGGVDGGRGWVGDIRHAHLDITKLKKIGWLPNLSSAESVDLASKELQKNLL